jgi:hypothetical protein
MINVASELYRPSDRRLSAKLVPTFADRGVEAVEKDIYKNKYFTKSQCCI